MKLPVKSFKIADGACSVDYLLGKSAKHIQRHIVLVMHYAEDRGQVVYSMESNQRHYYVKFQFRIEGDTAIVW